MSEFDKGIYLSLALFVLGSLVSIFSPDLRALLVDSFARINAPFRRRRNRSIERRIALLQELSSSLRVEVAYFANHIFMALLSLTVFLFFAFMLVLKVEPGTSSVGLVGFGLWLVRVISGPFDVSLQLKNPELSIERLRNRMRV